MHESELHAIIVNAIRAKCTGPDTPERDMTIDDLSIDIVVKLQLGGFQISKRSKNAVRT